MYGANWEEAKPPKLPNLAKSPAPNCVKGNAAAINGNAGLISFGTILSKILATGFVIFLTK